MARQPEPAGPAAKEAPKQGDECFVIMPISDQKDYNPGHFQLVFDDIIKPAVEEAGFKPVRADAVSATNVIHLEILEMIVKAPMAVCDVSSLNPNVMFELGVRQSFDKPVVLMKDTLTRNPFDINLLRYCEYDPSHSFRAVRTAHQKLVKALQETAAEAGSGGVNSLIRLLSLKAAASFSPAQESPIDARLELIEKSISQLANTINQNEKRPAAQPNRIDDRIISILDNNQLDPDMLRSLQNNVRILLKSARDNTDPAYRRNVLKTASRYGLSIEEANKILYGADGTPDSSDP